MKYIQDNYPWVTAYLYVPDYFLPLARNMLPNMIIRPFSKMKKHYNETYPGRQTRLKGHDSLSTHLVDYNFNCLANKQVEDKDKNYLKLDTSRINIESFNLPEEYVCISTGYTAPIRKFPGHTVNEIVAHLNARNIPVVFLGSKQADTGGLATNIISAFPEEIDYNKGINLVDKTSLLEVGKILDNAKCLIAVDCGLMHVAACTKTKIIGAYTSVEPRLRLPYRNNKLGDNCIIIEPSDSEPEKYFQSRIDFVYDVDFRYSINNNDNLVNSLKAEVFVEALEKIL